jgi:hypothetical protein
MNRDYFAGALTSLPGLASNQLAVLYARRRCLYDHLRLQDFADELGIGPLQADVIEATLLAVEA